MVRQISLGCGAAALLILTGSLASFAADETNQYVGAEKCKSCHAAASKGDPYGVWLKSDHAKAFPTLATPEALKSGATRNVAEPQKSPECLVCHETAFSAPATQKSKKFDPTQGVQCESCHGPGGNHVKARNNAEEEPGDKVVKVGKDEIVSTPGPQVCIQCHNEKSPNYKPFDYLTYLKKIVHLDPRRNHPADYLEQLAKAAKP